MGSAQCCNKIVQNEDVQEIVIGEVSNQQSAKLQEVQQVKHSYKKTEDCGTPAFPELRSQQSKKSEQQQSLKEIQFIGQVEKDEQIFRSSCTLGKKRQNDSPIVAFEAKNSLKSFDSNRLKKLQSVTEQQLNLKNISSPREEDSFIMQDSQRGGQPDEKSSKSILKQEMKYSRFRNQQNNADSTFRKVQFNLE